MRSAWTGVFTAMALVPLSAFARSETHPVITTDQVKAGRESYLTSCAPCHGQDLAGGAVPELAGQAFRRRWTPHTTAQLFVFVKTTMPKDAAASLPDEEYAAIVAFILFSNGAKAGRAAFSAQTDVALGQILSSGKRTQAKH
jgi:mono/diheme cytochrome c family protein